jgi:hypothetical protein
MFMKKRQAAKLAQILKQMTKFKGLEPAVLEEKILQLRQMDGNI